jgi:hypothetical protein
MQSWERGDRAAFNTLLSMAELFYATHQGPAANAIHCLKAVGGGMRYFTSPGRFAPSSEFVDPRIKIFDLKSYFIKIACPRRHYFVDPTIW